MKIQKELIITMTGNGPREMAIVHTAHGAAVNDPPTKKRKRGQKLNSCIYV